MKTLVSAVTMRAIRFQLLRIHRSFHMSTRMVSWLPDIAALLMAAIMVGAGHRDGSFRKK